MTTRNLYWISSSFGRFLRDHPKHTGVLYYYTEEETVDMNLLRSVVEAGRDRMAAEAGIDKQRIVVAYGGYMPAHIIHYWIKAPNSEFPKPSPAERPVTTENKSND